MPDPCTRTPGQRCALFDDPEAAREFRRRLAVRERFADSSHHAAELLSCNGCGQLFPWTWDDEIDFVAGDDPSWMAFFPVASAPEARALYSGGSAARADRAVLSVRSGGKPARTAWANTDAWPDV